MSGVLPFLRKPEDDLKRHGRLPGHAKALALELACRYRGLNQREIDGHFGNLSSMAVCMARRRFRHDHAQENPALQESSAKLKRMIVTGDSIEYLESDADTPIEDPFGSPSVCLVEIDGGFEENGVP